MVLPQYTELSTSYNKNNGDSMKVYVVVYENLNMKGETEVEKVFMNKEKAFQYATEQAKLIGGVDVKIHNNDGTRITNHHSLGSDYGITFKKNGRSSAFLIIPRTITE